MSGNGTSKALCPRQQALAGIARKPSYSQEQVGFAREGELRVSIPLGQSAAGLSLQCPSSSIASCCSFLPHQHKPLTLSGAGTGRR